jgi:hypothetical protein
MWWVSLKCWWLWLMDFAPRLNYTGIEPLNILEAPLFPGLKHNPAHQ